MYLKNIKSGCLIGAFLAVLFFLFLIFYMVFSDLSLLFFFIIALFACLQVINLFLFLILFLNKEKTDNLVLTTAFFGLTTFFVPGLIILISFFQNKKINLEKLQENK